MATKYYYIRMLTLPVCSTWRTNAQINSNQCWNKTLIMHLRVHGRCSLPGNCNRRRYSQSHSYYTTTISKILFTQIVPVRYLANLVKCHHKLFNKCRPSNVFQHTLKVFLRQMRRCKKQTNKQTNNNLKQTEISGTNRILHNIIEFFTWKKGTRVGMDIGQWSI